jgi:hypothetical protein
MNVEIGEHLFRLVLYHPWKMCLFALGILVFIGAVLFMFRVW